MIILKYDNYDILSVYFFNDENAYDDIVLFAEMLINNKNITYVNRVENQKTKIKNIK